MFWRILFKLRNFLRWTKNPELYFDMRDGEWSVRYHGQDLSDLAAVHHPNPVVKELGNFAVDLNIAKYSK